MEVFEFCEFFGRKDDRVFAPLVRFGFGFVPRAPALDRLAVSEQAHRDDPEDEAKREAGPVRVEDALKIPREFVLFNRGRLFLEKQLENLNKDLPGGQTPLDVEGIYLMTALRGTITSSSTLWKLAKSLLA